MGNNSINTRTAAAHLREFSLYIIVGFFGLALDWGVFFLMLGQGYGPVVAQWVGAGVGAVHNSIWHHYAVFSHSLPLKNTAVPNTLLSFLTVAVSGPLLLLVSEWVGNIVVAKLVVLCGITLLTYFLRKLFIFGNAGKALLGMLFATVTLTSSPADGAGDEAGDEVGAYDEDGNFHKTSGNPEAEVALDNVQAIFDELRTMSAEGVGSLKVSEHRSYRLVPAIREICRRAEGGGGGDLTLLKSAVAIASCESNPGRSHEWTYEFSKALRSYSEEEFKSAVESLPMANRLALREALKNKTPSGFKLGGVLEKLSTEQDYYEE